MASNGDKQEMIEILKGRRVIDFQIFEDGKHDEIQKFQKQFARDWNDSHKKVQTQMTEKVKMIHTLAEEWIELAYPNEKNIHYRNVSIKILICEENTTE
jgi:hypothetical protein